MSAKILQFAIPRPPKPLSNEMTGHAQAMDYIHGIGRRIRLAYDDPKALVRESIRRAGALPVPHGELPNRYAPSLDHTIHDLAFRVAVSEWADELRVISEFFPAWRSTALAAAALVNELEALVERIEGEARLLVDYAEGE